MAGATTRSEFDLYQRMVTASLVQYLQKQATCVIRQGVYSARVVIWLMISDFHNKAKIEVMSGRRFAWSGVWF
jgi:hypothetical protein